MTLITECALVGVQDYSRVREPFDGLLVVLVLTYQELPVLVPHEAWR